MEVVFYYIYNVVKMILVKMVSMTLEILHLLDFVN